MSRSTLDATPIALASGNDAGELSEVVVSEGFI